MWTSNLAHTIIYMYGFYHGWDTLSVSVWTMVCLAMEFISLLNASIMVILFTSLVALGVSTNISSVMMFRVWASMVVIVFEASLAIAVWRGRWNVLYSWAKKKTEVVKNTDRAFIEMQKVGRPRRLFLFTTLGTILQVFLEQRWTPEHATCNYFKTTFVHVPVLDYSCWCVRIINNIHVLIHQLKTWKRQTLKQGHN